MAISGSWGVNAYFLVGVDYVKDIGISLNFLEKALIVNSDDNTR